MRKMGTVVSRTFYTHRNLLNRRQGEPQGQSGGTEEEANTHFSSWNRYVFPSSPGTVYAFPGPYAYFSLRWRCDPTRVMASSFLRFLDHIQRRTTVGRTPLDEWSARRREFYLTTHNTHNRQTSMPPGGIRTHDLSRRAAADLRLRPRGYWDRLHKHTYCKEFRYPGG